MRYDYCCPGCNAVHEEVHGMLENPVIVCMDCGEECCRMISARPDQIFAASVPLYDFVDHKTTTKPVRIKSKREWNEHLKRVGQIEASNTPPSRQSIESADRTKKMVAKRELRQAVVSAVKDKRHIKKIKETLKKGG